MRTVRQIASITKVGIATIPQRLGSSAIVVVGIAGVVGVLVAILAMGTGFERTLKQPTQTIPPSLQQGQRREIGPGLDRDTLAVASQRPRILRNKGDRAIVSPEQLITVMLPKKSTGLDASVALRAVGERVGELRPEVRMIAGRRFKPGLRELETNWGQGFSRSYKWLNR